jgi:hypothetical protein
VLGPELGPEAHRLPAGVDLPVGQLVEGNGRRRPSLEVKVAADEGPVIGHVDGGEVGIH